MSAATDAQDNMIAMLAERDDAIGRLAMSLAEAKREAAAAQRQLRELHRRIAEVQRCRQPPCPQCLEMLARPVEGR